MISKIKKNVDKEERIGWDEYVTSLSYQFKEFITKVKGRSSDRRVIRSGYNVYPSGCDHIRIHRHYHEVNTIHAEQLQVAYNLQLLSITAEQNAISDASRRGNDIYNLFSVYKLCKINNKQCDKRGVLFG